MTRDYKKITKEVAQEGFFSEYLPPCFKLDEKIIKRCPGENCDLINPYCFTMSRYNNNDARRNIFIPEICSYLVTMNYIKQNSIVEDIIKFTEANLIGSFSPILGKDENIMKHEQVYGGKSSEASGLSSIYMENIVKKIIKATGAKKILKLDIASCFNSVYMHILPAILLRLEEAELNYNMSRKDENDQNISSKYKTYEKLDKLMRRQNLNRTNGILVGPRISQIIVEGLLTRIDIELKQEKIKFSRYMDDYEVYLDEDNEQEVISIFTRILKRYCLSLNNEKTEIVEFPYYVNENLEKIFNRYTNTNLDDSEIMELFNIFFTLEKNGTKGAIRFLLKSFEQMKPKVENTSIYKSYILTILGNNDRSLTKACSLLIENKSSMELNTDDVELIIKMLEKHISYEHDLEVIWLLYLLIETGKLQHNSPVLNTIVECENELAHTMLLRKNFLEEENLDKVINESKSWILLYELYAAGHISEEDFKNRLNIDRNLKRYQELRGKNSHFCF